MFCVEMRCIAPPATLISTSGMLCWTSERIKCKLETGLIIKSVNLKQDMTNCTTFLRFKCPTWTQTRVSVPLTYPTDCMAFIRLGKMVNLSGTLTLIWVQAGCLNRRRSAKQWKIIKFGSFTKVEHTDYQSLHRLWSKSIFPATLIISYLAKFADL